MSPYLRFCSGMSSKIVEVVFGVSFFDHRRSLLMWQRS